MKCSKCGKDATRLVAVDGTYTGIRGCTKIVTVYEARCNDCNKKR